jgi:hypothetical protein
MKKPKVKTIDIISKTNWNKTFGVSYTSAKVIVNYGLASEYTIVAPCTGSIRDGQIAWSKFLKSIGVEGYVAPWNWCQENTVILRETRFEDQKYRDVVRFGKQEESV